MIGLLRELGRAIIWALKLEMIERAARLLADKIEELWRKFRDWTAGRDGADEAPEAA